MNLTTFSNFSDNLFCLMNILNENENVFFMVAGIQISIIHCFMSLNYKASHIIYNTYHVPFDKW